MVKIRLQRYGARNRPFYRIVAAEARGRRDGRFIEQLGHYDTVSYSPKVSLKEERIKHWLSVGATPTETVGNLLRKQGLLTK